MYFDHDFTSNHLLVYIRFCSIDLPRKTDPNPIFLRKDGNPPGRINQDPFSPRKKNCPSKVSSPKCKWQYFLQHSHILARYQFAVLLRHIPYFTWNRTEHFFFILNSVLTILYNYRNLFVYSKEGKVCNTIHVYINTHSLIWCLCRYLLARSIYLKKWIGLSSRQFYINGKIRIQFICNASIYF
jgi:hypothetical protein